MLICHSLLNFIPFTSHKYMHVMFGFQYHTDYFFGFLFLNKTTGNFAKYYNIYNEFFLSVFLTYHFEDRILCSQTSPNQPLWGPKKVAIVERWPLWGGGGVIWQFLVGENNMSCCSPLTKIVINAPYGSNFLTIPDLFVSCWKNWPLWRGFFGSWGRSAVDVAVVERFKLEPMYRLSAGQKKSGYCREVAGSGLVWLYIPFIFSSKFFAINDFPREGRLIISKVINR